MKIILTFHFDTKQLLLNHLVGLHKHSYKRCNTFFSIVVSENKVL